VPGSAIAGMGLGSVEVIRGVFDRAVGVRSHRLHDR
jgi:hypothetical protein